MKEIDIEKRCKIDIVKQKNWHRKNYFSLHSIKMGKKSYFC